MSVVAKMFKVPEPAASPAARFTPVGRIAAAATLVLGAGFQLASWLTEPAANDPTADRLQWIADHPDAANLTKVFDLLAMPFLFGSVLVYVLLSRQRSPRLAYVGGILLGCGMVGLSAVMGFETLEFRLAQDGRFDPTALADTVDNISAAPAIAMLLLFIPPALFGLLTITVALWRSDAVPRGAILTIPAFIVLDFFLQMGLAAHAIAFVGNCWIASAVRGAGRAAPATFLHRAVEAPVALIVTAAGAAIISTAVVGSSGAQQPGPPIGTLELVTRDRETRFTFVDNPPRRREARGDLIMIVGRLRDGSNRPAGRVHGSFAETKAAPRYVQQGSATFILGNGRIMVTGALDNRGRNDRTDTLAVVGGSGAYAGARGTVVSTASRKTQRFRFTFAD